MVIYLTIPSQFELHKCCITCKTTLQGAAYHDGANTPTRLVA